MKVTNFTGLITCAGVTVRQGVLSHDRHIRWLVYLLTNHYSLYRWFPNVN